MAANRLSAKIGEISKEEKIGGGKRDRTADLLHAMQALSQLSYTPTLRKCLVEGKIGKSPAHIKQKNGPVIWGPFGCFPG